MARSLVTPPATLPVPLAELKGQLRLGDDETAEHYLLYGYLRAAIELVEGFTGRALISRTYDLTLDEFPAEITLPKPPARSVTSISYVDDAGAAQTLATADYQVDVASQPGRVRPAYLESWPSTRLVYNAVTVRWVAGYGDDPADVPENLRLAISLAAATWWETRTDLKPAMLDALPAGSRTLMLPFITPYG
jgi:uncharacterized phiE125 gp8 family phage protein